MSATGIQSTPGHIHALPAAMQHAIAHTVGHSLHDVFLFAAPIALVGFLVVLSLRELPLRGRAHVPTPKDKEEKPCPSSAASSAPAST